MAKREKSYIDKPRSGRDNKKVIDFLFEEDSVISQEVFIECMEIRDQSIEAVKKLG